VTLGWDAPLPPLRTGVADYAQILLESLRQRVPVALPGEAADRWIYHLGNNQLHAPIHRRALANPGVIVLHDAVLMHFFLGSMTEAEFVEEFQHNYGGWNAEYAADLYRRRSRSAGDPDYFNYPLLKRICERSRAIIVHNRSAARMVHEHCPTAEVHEIPHFYHPGPGHDEIELIGWQQRNRITVDTYVFGLFGYLRESKRVLSVLRAFASLEDIDARLILAGEFASPELERAAAPWLGHPRILRYGHTDPRLFSLLLAAADCGINLRYPSAGESSGIGVRLMGLGKPTIVTANEDTSGWPAAIAFPVDPGLAEEEMLREAMLWMVRNPGEARAIGRRAAWHIEHTHSLDRVTSLYLSAAGF